MDILRAPILITVLDSICPLFFIKGLYHIHIIIIIKNYYNNVLLKGNKPPIPVHPPIQTVLAPTL